MTCMKTVFLDYLEFTSTPSQRPLYTFEYHEADMVIELAVAICGPGNFIPHVFHRRILCDVPTFYIIVKKDWRDIDVLDYRLPGPESLVRHGPSRRVRARS